MEVPQSGAFIKECEGADGRFRTTNDAFFGSRYIRICNAQCELLLLPLIIFRHEIKRFGQSVGEKGGRGGADVAKAVIASEKVRYT